MVNLKILTGRTAKQNVLVRRFPFSVGRKGGSSFQSEEAGVWDEHFQIEYHSAKGIILVPVEGATTMVDSEVISFPVRLRSGVEISAGGLRLIFNITDPEIRSYRFREMATWLTIVFVLAIQIWLLIALPK